MADVRDMYLAHTLFRREFARLPGLILSIADGGIAGAETVSAHVAMLCRLLHLHHEGEDLLLWPKLAARGGVEADAIVPVMEKQHHIIEAALARVDERRLRALEEGLIDADYAMLVRLAKTLGVPPAIVVTRAEQLAREKADC